MTEATKDRRSRASANFRHKKERQGEAQVNFWLRAELRDKLEELVSSGRFKNRSEVASVALSRLLEGQEM